MTLPTVPTRSLDAYRIDCRTDGTDGGEARERHDPAALPADLNEGLKRLKMAAVRRLAPDLLLIAKTQPWEPEEFLRTLIEAEVASLEHPMPAP